MIRKIIKIDEDLCNGCGLCAQACHEGAIALVDGRAKLIRDDYCDGLGNCLPVCPTGAISFEEREAAEYNEELVKQHQQSSGQAPAPVHHGGCPGSRAMAMNKPTRPAVTRPAMAREESVREESELRQWPVQIQLVPVNAPYFENANLLVAADCSAFAYAGFHKDFIRNHITLIGCPKLDHVDYAEKLTAILKHNNIRSIKVVRMEVPCCGGIEHAVKQALIASGKMIPWQVSVISVNGELLDD